MLRWWTGGNSRHPHKELQLEFQREKWEIFKFPAWINCNNPIIHKPLIVVIALIGSEEQAFT